MTEQSKKRKRESKSIDEIISEIEKSVQNQQNAADVVVHLVHKYSFNITELQAKAAARGLDVGFSSVTYQGVAPHVGLAPSRSFDDVPCFDLLRARLPNRVMETILDDIQVTARNYGLPIEHRNEEARSRFLSPILLQICNLFERQLQNVPESIMPGRIATKGRIEYHYILLGLINVIFVEMKLKLGSGIERLDAIAQVIAEADGCDLANSLHNFHIPVLCVLYDGEVFQFFRFVHGDAKPFARGRFKTSSDSGVSLTTTSVPLCDPVLMNEQAFFLSLRPVCEAIYYCFLSAFVNGLQGMSETPGHEDLSQAAKLAAEARTLAVQADDLAQEHEYEKAASEADSAVTKIGESILAIPEKIRKPTEVLEWRGKLDVARVRVIHVAMYTRSAFRDCIKLLIFYIKLSIFTIRLSQIRL